MQNLLTGLLILIGVLLFAAPLFVNVVGPFLIWRSQRIPTLVRLPSIGDQAFAENMSAEAVLQERALLALGFVKLDSSSLEDTHVTTFFRIYWNAQSELAAMIAIAKSAKKTLGYLEIAQKYEDGTELDVSNAPRAGAYPALAHKLAYRLPRLSTVEELLDAHARLRRKHKPDVRPARFEPERGLRVLEDGLRNESEALLRLGLVESEIGDDGKRALTLRGAIAMTYRAVPPGLHIWNYLTRRRSERALAAT